MQRLINGKRFVVGLATAVLMMAAPALVRADGLDNLVAVDNLPDVVLDKAKEVAPGVDWLVAFEFKDATVGTYYRIGGKDSGEHLVTAIISKKGVVAAVRTEVEPEDVPEVVTSALKAKAPGFKATKVETVGKTTAKVLYYRFEGENAGGEVVMGVGADGKKVFRDE